MKRTVLLFLSAAVHCAGPAAAAENPNLAPRAEVTASVAADAATKVAD